MPTIPASKLRKILEDQLKTIDSKQVLLEEKITSLTLEINQIIAKFTKKNPDQATIIFNEKNDLNNLLVFVAQLEKIKPQNNDTIIDQLKRLINDYEKFSSIQENNKENISYLHQAMQENEIEIEKKAALTNEKIIDILQLIPLKSCTSEEGSFKEFLRVHYEQGESLTNIFYLLKENEKSFFHFLDTDETWTWFLGEPLSLFTIENGQLIEQTLNESNPTITIAKGTWFAAQVEKNSAQLSETSDQDRFTLVSCRCIPAFIFEHFHDKPNDELINCFNEANDKKEIIKAFIAPNWRDEFDQKIAGTQNKQEPASSRIEKGIFKLQSSPESENKKKMSSSPSRFCSIL